MPRLLVSFAGFQSAWLRSDLIAGLTVWAVLVPEALAYASIAGVPPVVGLYAAPAALVLYALFGSSRHLIVGPMSATAAVSAATIADFAMAGTDQFTALTVALAITVGIAALLAGLLRLGFIANFISEPVLKGFIIGLAITIIIGQLDELIGVEGGSGNAIEKLLVLVRNLGDLNPTATALGFASLAIVLGLRRFAPLVPGSLVAVGFGIVAVRLMSLDSQVDIVGTIPSGLPAFGLPDVMAVDYGMLIPGALGVVLIGFAEGLGAARTYAQKAGYEVDANAELMGLGAANLGAGLSSGMVVNGSLSKTAVNGGAGAKSQVSGLVVAAMTVITLLFLTGLFELLPEATLGAVVIAAVIELVDFSSLRRLYRLGGSQPGLVGAIVARPDFLAAVTALLGVLLFDTLPGLAIGVLVSILLLLYRASRPPVAVIGRVPGASGQWSDTRRHPEYEQIEGVVAVRPGAALFFANADYIRQQIMSLAAERKARFVILDLEAAPYMDITGAEMLGNLRTTLARNGVELVVAHELAPVRTMARRAARGETEEADRPIEVFATVQEAADYASER
ncbi:MAG TPA: SulP family inorganic anion transporter [Candidatus Limnocylindrales bacterium]|nr:SulP family inorganic anion transporter [Candidatus Limnocylindrales bacterium]